MTLERPSTSGNVRGTADRLAHEVKRRRREFGWSQPELARMIGYTRQYVSLAERVGQNLPSQELVKALDTALDANGALLHLREQANSEQQQHRARINGPALELHHRTSIGGVRLTSSDVGEPSIPRWMIGSQANGQVGTTLSRQDISMAAEESAMFGRWSAEARVDSNLLDQMDADVSELAKSYLLLPPAAVFPRVVQARNQTFQLIADKQTPRLAMRLYKVAGHLCGLLAHISADLGYGHAANTHARTALRCAEMAEYPYLVGYVRWVQSNVAYWEGDYNTAADLIDGALRSAPSEGTARLRLISQRARIESKRNRANEAYASLAQVEELSKIALPDEQGVFAFSSGKAAYYASEAHRDLGGSDSLETAVQWAKIAVSELSMQSDTSTTLVAAARFDLARALLMHGDLDAASEQVRPILVETDNEFRTVPVLGRASGLRGLLAESELASLNELAYLKEGLDHFCLSPAKAPADLAVEIDNSP